MDMYNRLKKQKKKEKMLKEKREREIYIRT